MAGKRTYSLSLAGHGAIHSGIRCAGRYSLSLGSHLDVTTRSNVKFDRNVRLCLLEHVEFFLRPIRMIPVESMESLHVTQGNGAVGVRELTLMSEWVLFTS